MNRREANKSMNLTKVHKILVFNKEIVYFSTIYSNSMTEINPLVGI